MARKPKPKIDQSTAATEPKPVRSATKPKPAFRIVDTIRGNPDYDFEAVIETDLPDGTPYRVGVLVTVDRATYRHDKAAAELQSLGVDVDAQTLADIAIG